MKLVVVLIFASLICLSAGVDHSKFKTCSDASFCKRHRGKTFESHYHVIPESLKISADAGIVEGELAGGPSGSAPLLFRVLCYTVGVARLRITEKIPLHGGRWQPEDVVLDSELKAAKLTVSQQDDSAVTVTYTGESSETKSVALELHPFSLELSVSGHSAITVNSRNLLHFEHHRLRRGAGGAAIAAAADTAAADGAGVAAEDNEEKEIVDWGEDGKPIYADGSVGAAPGEAADGDNPSEPREAGLDSENWEETFGGHTDTRPFGPAAVSVGVSFPGTHHVYGIPEHATTLSLKPTTGAGPGSYAEPYRLYTLDVFEYEMDQSMALYGATPIMLAHSPKHTVGVFWFNPSETFIDVAHATASTGAPVTDTHWMSESGIVDVLMMPGPSPAHVYRQIMKLTGRPQLPPLFSLGYHQCRWNYRDEADVKAVNAQFEALNIPYDVLWLDIEHTDGKRYFTWDNALFPNPVEMQNNLTRLGRKMVTIIDPHIKRDSGYRIHQNAESRGLYIKNKDGGDFDGWCWPGSSSYLDFTTPKVRDWWADQFKLDAYTGSTASLYTWNDMNEPSVFNGPEVTMQKDCKSLSGVEHREWHNMYGYYMQMATVEGQIRRHDNRNERAFLLSRAFFAGSQRYGAIWTGDNAANWPNLRASIPMLLSISLTTLGFAGADVGGFFGNPDTELMTRWMQLGAYQPFFRNHAHHDSKRREPWVFGEPHTTRLRNAILSRYQLLPYWYTLFQQSHVTGMPPMRPMWSEFPKDTQTFAMETQYMAGDALLVAPVLNAGETSVRAYLPAGTWYDLASGLSHRDTAGRTITVAAPIDIIPVFQRGGTVVPRQMRLRRSSALMANDPFTLCFALDSNGKAAGDLYLDDGHTFNFQTGLYRRRTLSYSGHTLTSTASTALAAGAPTASDAADAAAGAGGGNKQFAPANTVERIIVRGVTSQPTSVTVTAETGASGAAPRALEFTYDRSSKTLTLRKPDVKIAYDWAIALAF